jgi:TolB-like protein/class 3 adenylate cyclase/Tfp pilus assembly protein PilF
VSETRKLAAILVADVVGFSRLAGADEERTLARLRGLRSDLIDPTIAVHHGRIVKRTGDGSVIEFRSVVDAVRCAIEVQTGLIERNAGVPAERRIEFRVGVHLGDVVEESDGDLMGEGVNVAARLEGIAKPGAICLSEDAYRQVKSRLDLKVTDLGAVRLKNIAEPVHVYSLEVGEPSVSKPASAATVALKPESGALAPGRSGWGLRWPALAAALALVLIAAGAYGWRSGLAPRVFGGVPVAEDKPKTAPRLSVVVLPFENLSGDKEQDYFADGITDDLTTDLSHLSDFVISRKTAFTYKGKPVDAKAIGRELGVRYVLEGSVRRSGDKVAVNAQLISAETGTHLWADRFEGERANLGQLQVEFVSRLANSLGVELVKAEALRLARERPKNPDAADLAMQGWALTFGMDDKDRYNDGIKLFERALALDPKNVAAMTGLALVLQWRAWDRWSEDWDRDFGRAGGLIQRALALQPENSMLRNASAEHLSWRDQYRAAVAEAETAIAYDRNNAVAYANAGFWKQYLGRNDEGVADLETALRLDPHDGGFPWRKWALCRAHNLLGRWERAIEWCDKAVAAGPDVTDALVDLASANAWAGHDKEAKDAVARLRKARPGFTMQKLRPEDLVTDDPTFKAQFARIVEGLRRAGLPDEPTTATAHLAWASALNDARAWDLALKEVEAAIADDPNSAEAYGSAGLYKMFLGRSEEGLADVETALRLSPNDKEVRTWLAYLCFIHAKLAQWDQAIESCQKAENAVPSGSLKTRAIANLAAAYAWTGHDKEARDAIERLKLLDPNFTALTYQEIIDTHPNPTYQAQTTRALEGMRKAGLPEE